jgi:predicted hydrocarbon binding protein
LERLLLANTQGTQGPTHAAELLLELRTGRAVRHMRLYGGRLQPPVIIVKSGQFAVHERREPFARARTVESGGKWCVGRQMRQHGIRTLYSGPLSRKAADRLPRDIREAGRCACIPDPHHISIPCVSSLIDGRPARATAPAEPMLALSGGPLDARLPLALLEAVKAIDTPEAELDAELVHELRNKRLGLSDTVYQQILRYTGAVRSRQRVGYDEVLALARLIGRRPDADLAFREAGRRWARSCVSTVGGLQRRAARTLPSLLARPIALRQLRTLARRFMDGVLVRQGGMLLLDVKSPVSVDAAPRAVGCGLYEAAFREALHLLADADSAVEHVMCRSRGDRHCQWRVEWRRR